MFLMEVAAFGNARRTQHKLAGKCVCLENTSGFWGVKGKDVSGCSDQHKQGFGEPGTLTAESQNGYDLEGFVIKDLDAKVL